MKLRSYQFRKEREESWQELERLVEQGEKRGLGNLTTKDMFRLPVLYRAALSSLSVSRSITLETNVVSYLESLSSRAYFILYGARGNPGRYIVDFFRRRFPEEVRAAFFPILISAAVMLLGGVVGFILSYGSADWFYTFIPETMAQGRTPANTTEELRTTLFQSNVPELGALSIFSTFLFTHNARIGMMAFALGFAFGFPTILLLFYNGATLGAFVSLFVSRGLGFELAGWLLVHGTTELLAIVLCGGAGLVLARGVIFPASLSRRESLAKRGKGAGIIVIGTVFLFFTAGLLEGYARQLILVTETRLLIGGLMLGFWLLYFSFGGRIKKRKTNASS